MTEVNMRPPEAHIGPIIFDHIQEILNTCSAAFLPPLNTAAQYWYWRKATDIELYWPDIEKKGENDTIFGGNRPQIRRPRRRGSSRSPTPTNGSACSAASSSADLTGVPPLGCRAPSSWLGARSGL